MHRPGRRRSRKCLGLQTQRLLAQAQACSQTPKHSCTWPFMRTAPLEPPWAQLGDLARPVGAWAPVGPVGISRHLPSITGAVLGRGQSSLCLETLPRRTCQVLESSFARPSLGLAWGTLSICEMGISPTTPEEALVYEDEYGRVLALRNIAKETGAD